MAQELNKRFCTQEVKMLFQKYLDEKVRLAYILEILKIKSSRFSELLKGYNKDPEGFSIEYRRKSPTRKTGEDVDKRRYLITGLDDHSRILVYSRLVQKETSWCHIIALQGVFLTWGDSSSHDVNSHSIFRFVQGTDSLWRRHYSN